MTLPAHRGRAVGAEPGGEADATALPPHGTVRSTRGRATPALRSTHATRPGILLVTAVLVAVMALVAAGCGSPTGATPGAGGQPRDVSVFAAASLTEAFTQLGEDFAAVNPDVTVTLNFAGSNDLVAQVRQGAPADVLATADARHMDDAGRLVDEPRTFAGNALVIAVAPGNPEGITGLADLARTDLKVVLAAPDVPAGRYAEEILGRAGVTVRPVSLEVSVKGVVTKVSLGEADAGIVYVTDVAAAQGQIDGVAIPDDQDVVAAYLIGTLAASGHPDDARAFVDFVLSPNGQKVLAEKGFLAAP
jgi:molybdate transport system substrate-binding protein